MLLEKDEREATELKSLQEEPSLEDGFNDTEPQSMIDVNEALPLHEDALEGTSFDRKGPTEHSTKTLLLQISTTHVRATVLNEDGSLRPMKLAQDDKHAVPFLMACIQVRFFVFGEEIPKYRDRAKSIPEYGNLCQFWNLGDLVQQKKPTTVVVYIGGRVFKVSAELLLGLYLEYLKKLADDSVNYTFEKVVLAVPLWFSCLFRQNLESAATLAGFKEVSIVNEATIAILMHISSARNLTASKISPTTFVIVSENSGNVDIVVYKRSRSSSLEMIFSAGNLHGDSELVRNSTTYRKSYELLKNTTKQDTRNGVRKLLLQTLTKEMKIKLPGMDNYYDLVVFCEDSSWMWSVEDEFRRLPTLYEHLGAAPFYDKTGAWKSAVLAPGDFHHVKELYAFQLHFTDAIYKVPSGPLTKQEADLKELVKIRIKLNFPTTKAYIYERTILGQEFVIGRVDIERVLHYHFGKIELILSLGKQREVQMVTINGCKANGVYVKTLYPHDDFIWLPGSLTKLKMESAHNDFKEITEASNAYKKHATQLWHGVWALCEQLQQNFWAKIKPKKKLSKKRRNRIKKTVNEALDALQKVFDPLELDQLKLEEWDEKFSRYLKNYYD